VATAQLHPPAAARDAHAAIPLLFIAGAPRSGSTLLERVIGLHEGFVPTGETHFIWERCFGANQLCGCGEPFHRCPFWRAVSQRAFGAQISAVDAEHGAAMQRAVNRKRELPWLLAQRGPRRHEAALEAYGAVLRRLYGAILDVSDGRVIVDSSKDPRHGLILARAGFQLHVVHLVRDPRAVVFSWRRVKERPEIHWEKQGMPVEPLARTAGRWTSHNLLIERLDRCAASYCRVRYEDFVLYPGRWLSAVLAPYPWVHQPLINERTEVVHLAPTHTTSGNPMRFQHGAVTLQLDDEWCTSMSAWSRRVATALTLPLMWRYGYSPSALPSTTLAATTPGFSG
jgi:Sulfotransferase family